MFARPVPLKTTGRSNVRSGPGLTFDVKFTLESGASIVGQSYTSQWVRIVDDSGREGWIFQTLVSSR
jgi:SH3-like domain-containing protein